MRLFLNLLKFILLLLIDILANYLRYYLCIKTCLFMKIFPTYLTLSKGKTVISHPKGRNIIWTIRYSIASHNMNIEVLTIQTKTF